MQMTVLCPQNYYAYYTAVVSLCKHPLIHCIRSGTTQSLHERSYEVAQDLKLHNLAGAAGRGVIWYGRSALGRRRSAVDHGHFNCSPGRAQTAGG